MRLPAPGVCAHRFKAKLRLPRQFTVGFGWIGVRHGQITRALETNLIGHSLPGDPLESLDHLEHRIRLPGPQVVGNNPWVISKFIQRFDVSQGQIDNMDVIPQAGAIRGVVVIAVNSQLRTHPDRHLGDIRQQVEGHTPGVFADTSAGMGTHRVEVAQQDQVGARLGNVQIAEDLLHDHLGPAIGVGG